MHTPFEIHLDIYVYKVYRSHVNMDIDHNSLGQNVIISFVDVN